MADGMYSHDNEYIEFIEPIYLEGQVEYWLRNTGESASSKSFFFSTELYIMM